MLDDNQLGTGSVGNSGATPSAVSPEGQTQSVAAPGPIDAPPPQEDMDTLIQRLEQLPEDQVDALVSKTTQFGKHVSKRVDRAVTEYDKRRHREEQERQVALTTAKAIVTDVETTPLDQRALRFQQEPSLLTRYQQAKENLDGNPHIKVAAERMKNKVWQQLSEKYQGLDEAEALKGDVADLIDYVAGHAAKARVKDMETDIQTTITAAVNAELAKRNLTAPQAPRTAAAATSGAPGRFTREQIADPEFYRQHRAEIMAARIGR